jgi:hypothetical protein
MMRNVPCPAGGFAPGGLAGRQAVGLSAGFDDVGVEDDIVDDGQAWGRGTGELGNLLPRPRLHRHDHVILRLDEGKGDRTKIMNHGTEPPEAAPPRVSRLSKQGLETERAVVDHGCSRVAAHLPQPAAYGHPEPRTAAHPRRQHTAHHQAFPHVTGHRQTWTSGAGGDRTHDRRIMSPLL